MIESIISSIVGPLGGILAGLGALIAALVLGRWQGGRDANTKRDANDMADAYNRERTRDEIDRTTSGADARDKLRDKWRRD